MRSGGLCLTITPDSEKEKNNPEGTFTDSLRPGFHRGALTMSQAVSFSDGGTLTSNAGTG